MKTFTRLLIAICIAVPICVTMPIWDTWLGHAIRARDGDSTGFAGILMGLLSFPVIVLTAFFGLDRSGRRKAPFRVCGGLVVLLMIANLAMLREDLWSDTSVHHINLEAAAIEMQEIQANFPAFRFGSERRSDRLVIKARRTANEEGVITILQIGFVDCQVVSSGGVVRDHNGVGISTASEVRAPIVKLLKAM